MQTYTLPEENGHIVSFTEYGNPNGPAIISFHGGPGSKSKPSHAEVFDLHKYRVIHFDQRGCGESTPQGEIEHNTIQDLLHDAERIREQLGIDRWFVAGSSWGSTLALLYAQAYPLQTKGLMLSSVWLAERGSMEWGYYKEEGVVQLMPDVYEKRRALLERFNTTPEKASEVFIDILEHGEYHERQEIAAGVINWEHNLFSPDSPIHYVTPEEITEDRLAYVKVFLHYEKNRFFVTENQIMEQAESIAHLPTIMVHGRYDILCPIVYPYELQKKLPKSELIVCERSGHNLSSEGCTIRKLAYDRFLAAQV